MNLKTNKFNIQTIHKEWRKNAKKIRRKRLRQQIARERNHEAEEAQTHREKSPTYQQWLKDQENLEQFRAAEEERLAVLAQQEYLEREKEAQTKWQELQKKLQHAKLERAKQVARIKEEWEAEQRKLRKQKEEMERKEQEKREKCERLQNQIEEFINSHGDMPAELNEMLESNPGKIVCPFFKKTAACRFNDSCSRNHVRPTISRILLIRNFYSHYSLEQTMENEHGSDSILEFETHEMYNHFKDFFNDVLPELQKFGQVRQLKVCCNQEVHLRGNVYVEFSKCRDALKAYRALQGRWYGGKQLNVEFCNIGSWKSAICGLFFQQRCPKGSICNFLHVFRNPANLFSHADRDHQRTPPSSSYLNSETSTRNWRWSESPERLPSDKSSEQRKNTYINGTQNKYKRNRESSRNINSEHNRGSGYKYKSRSISLKCKKQNVSHRKSKEIKKAQSSSRSRSSSKEHSRERSKSKSKSHDSSRVKNK